MTVTSTVRNHVLVTGAGGLVGRAVVRQLSDRGQPLTSIDKFACQVDGVPVIECDLRDVHRLHGIACAAGIDSIVHCGAYSGPMVGRGNPYDMIAVNVTGTANLLELARLTGISRFVYCSSMSVYGTTASGPVGEMSPMMPSTVYGATKLAAEQLVLAYAREHALDAAAMRLSWIYGPDRSTACILRRMIDDALDGKPTRQDWGGDFPRQYIHAEDAARALIAALDAAVLETRVYNITGENVITLGELAAQVQQFLPEADIALAPGRAPDDDYHHEFDTAAARRELRFRPAISLQQGVETMIAEIRRRRAEKEIRPC